MTLAGVVALLLVLLWAAPGDPIDLLPNADDVRPVLEEDWHLDEPLPMRLLHYGWSALHGDLGTSVAYRPGAPVLEVIGGPGLRSLVWVGGALVLSLGAGLFLAFLGPRTSRRATHRALQALSIAPVFLLAVLAVNGLNALTWHLVQEGWIQRPEWFALPLQDSPVRTALAVTILAVGSGTLAEVTQEIHNALHEIRRSGYVQAARARGEAIWPHVAGNLVAPLTSIATRRIAFFVGGLVILERVLLLDGAGAILWHAAQLRDYELALGIGLCAGAVVCGARLVGDSIRLAVDPRLRAVR